jgi:hypothetical protein
MKTLVVLVAILYFSTPATAAIETVQLSVGTGPHDGSKVHHVSGGLISGFRLPVISGTTHKFILTGDSLDLCDRIEISGSGVAAHTLLPNSLQISTANGKGKIIFNLNGSFISSTGTFAIKVRYPFNMKPPDSLECMIVRRARIDSFEWLTSVAVDNDPVPETSHIGKANYSLRATGTNFPPTQVFDGVTNKILGGAISNLTTTSNTITVAFAEHHDLEFTNPLNSPSAISFADSSAGDIVGGWGDYIYYRFGSLPNTGNLTNLAHVVVGNPGSLNPLEGRGTGVLDGSINIERPDIAFTFLNVFRSGKDSFINNEVVTYRLCASTVNPKITSIPALTLRVMNHGGSFLNSFQVRVSRNGQVLQTFEVTGGMESGATKDLVIPRRENRVCAALDMHTCSRCAGSSLQPIAIWNDLGIEATVVPGGLLESDYSNNSLMIQ